MTNKPCDCQFCKDHQYLIAMLPSIPEEHRAFVTRMAESFWNTDEDLSYKRAILDGSWPSSVEILEHALANAKARLAATETPINFDCKVCEKCSKAMTAKEYWDHKCEVPALVTKEPAPENNLPDYDEETSDEDDGWYGGGDHQGNFF